MDLTSLNGAAVNGDIASIKIFRDVRNDGIFNVQERSKSAAGNSLNLMTLGTETLSNYVTTLTLVTPEVIQSETVNPAGQNYFLTYDINPFAQVGVNVGAQIAATSYFTIAFPDVAQWSAITPPFNTELSGHSAGDEPCHLVG